MPSARTISPFCNVETEQPWVLWQRNDSVLELPEEENVKTPVVYDELRSDNHASDLECGRLSFPGIKRSQYDSIVQRINNAKKQSGSYSAWTT